MQYLTFNICTVIKILYRYFMHFEIDVKQAIINKIVHSLRKST